MYVPGLRPGMTHGLPGTRGRAASRFTAEGDKGTTRAARLRVGQPQLLRFERHVLPAQGQD